MRVALSTHRAAGTFLVPRSKVRFVPEFGKVFCMLSVSHLLPAWPFASIMLQARSRLHVRRPGSCQLHVFCYWLQVLCRLTVGCCNRQAPGCTVGKRPQVCTLSKRFCMRCSEALALMYLQLCAISVLFAIGFAAMSAR